MRTTGSREVYRNPWIRVREDAVERADGSAGVYSVVEKPHFALVLPYERDGFWLVEQFRYPVGRRAWEFPQGTWTAGSTVPRCAARWPASRSAQPRNSPGRAGSGSDSPSVKESPRAT